ncbi:hypothetical protein [Kribbella sp. NPDC048928]|uniref:hypothetical protein n=1 Tax=Kribbella sp. NPDC048928 TaxID=3364111 RepID=UPI0037208671
MPPTPNPQTLHQALTTTHPLNWGALPTTTELTHRHGAKATRASLKLLEQAAAAEPTVTSQFLESLPSGTIPYQLDHRVKSPDSLARKVADWEATKNPLPIDDVLRYTVLTESPDDLVAAARRTADSLSGHGWQVYYAMHSYTEGSRYKGIHANLVVPGSPGVEVQIHSVASANVKELTTSWYAIERSATASADERTEARQQCIEASATLDVPRGIAGLTHLGGRRVAVNNYSDSRRAAEEHAKSQVPGRSSRPTNLDRNGGITR